MDDQTREDTVEAEVMETPLSENDARAVIWNNFSQGIQWYWQSVLTGIILLGVICVFHGFFYIPQKQLSNQLSVFLCGALLALPVIIWNLACIVYSIRCFWGTQSVWLPNAHRLIVVFVALATPGWLFTPANLSILQQEVVSFFFVPFLCAVLNLGGRIYCLYFLRQFAREFAPDLYALYNTVFTLYSITGVSFFFDDMPGV